MGLSPTLKTFTGKIPIATLTFWTNHENKFDICGVCRGKVGSVLAYRLSEGAKDVYKAYTASGLSTDAHVYHNLICGHQHPSSAFSDEIRAPAYA